MFLSVYVSHVWGKVEPQTQVEVSAIELDLEEPTPLVEQV